MANALQERTGTAGAETHPGALRGAETAPARKSKARARRTYRAGAGGGPGRLSAQTLLACAGWSRRMRSPGEPTSPPSLPSLPGRRRGGSREERKPKLAGLRGGNRNKIRKSGGFTPLVVIPWAGRDPSAPTLCVRPFLRLCALSQQPWHSRCLPLT